MELTSLRYGIAPKDVGFAVRSAISEYRAARRQLLESFAVQLKLPVKAFTDPPVRSDNASKTYCPICRAQFRLSEGVCPDCPERPAMRSVTRTRGPGQTVLLLARY